MGTGTAERKERQLVFLLARQLADAQFMCADAQRTERLWREVAALEIDPERVTALLYGGHDLGDPDALACLDRAFRPAGERRDGTNARPARSWGWSGGGLRPWRSGGARRNAPPAGSPARPAAR